VTYLAITSFVLLLHVGVLKVEIIECPVLQFTPVLDKVEVIGADALQQAELAGVRAGNLINFKKVAELKK